MISKAIRITSVSMRLCRDGDEVSGCLFLHEKFEVHVCMFASADYSFIKQQYDSAIESIFDDEKFEPDDKLRSMSEKE